MPLDFQDITLSLDRLPAELDGVRIWHLSDLHAAPGRRIFAQAREILNRHEAELMVITGDLCASWEHWEFSPAVLEQLLCPIRWPLGCFAVLGNHDRDSIVEHLSRWGVRFLVNECLQLNHKGAAFNLAGDAR